MVRGFPRSGTRAGVGIESLPSDLADNLETESIPGERRGGEQETRGERGEWEFHSGASPGC